VLINDDNDNGDEDDAETHTKIETREICIHFLLGRIHVSILNTYSPLYLHQMAGYLHTWIDGGMLSATIADFPQYSTRIAWASFLWYFIFSLTYLGAAWFCVLAYKEFKKKAKRNSQSSTKTEWNHFHTYIHSYDDLTSFYCWTHPNQYDHLPLITSGKKKH